MAQSSTRDILLQRPSTFSPLPDHEENRHLFLSISPTSTSSNRRAIIGRLSPVDSATTTRDEPLTPMSPPALYGWGGSSSPDNMSEWSDDNENQSGVDIQMSGRLRPLLQLRQASVVSPVAQSLISEHSAGFNLSPSIINTVNDPLDSQFNGPTRPIRRNSASLNTTVGAFLPRLKIGDTSPVIMDRPFSPLEPLKNNATKLGLNHGEMSDEMSIGTSLEEASIDLEHSFGDGELDEAMNKQFTRTPNRTKSVSQYPPKSPIFMKLTKAPKEGGGYLVIKGLGMGGYASVLLCQHVATSKLYSMKVIAKQRVHKMGDRVRIKRELHALTEIKPSPFLLHCYSAFESRTCIFFICDYFEGGDIFYQLALRSKEGHRGFPEDEIRVTLAEIALGISHLHEHNFIHRDIKAENVMINSDGHAKIIDFGLAKGIPPQSHLPSTLRPSSSKPAQLKTFYEFPLSVSGSLIYMPPELLRTGLGGRHTDWWALGVLAHELLTGRTPWSSLTNKKMIRKDIKSLKIQTPMKLSPPAGLFICSLLRREPSHRLGTTTAVTTAPYFQSINWTQLLKCEYKTYFSKSLSSQKEKRRNSNNSIMVNEQKDEINKNSASSKNTDTSASTAATGSSKDTTQGEDQGHMKSKIKSPFRSSDCRKALENYISLSVEEDSNVENQTSVKKDNKEVFMLKENGKNGHIRTSGSTSQDRDSGGGDHTEKEYWTLGLETIFTHPPVMSESDIEAGHFQ